MAILKNKFVSKIEWKAVSEYITKHIADMESNRKQLDKERGEINDSIIALGGHISSRIKNRMNSIKNESIELSQSIKEYEELGKKIASLDGVNRSTWIMAKDKNRDALKNGVVSENNDTLDMLLEKSKSDKGLANLIDSFYSNINDRNAEDLYNSIIALEQKKANISDDMAQGFNGKTFAELSNDLYETDIKLQLALKKHYEKSQDEAIDILDKEKQDIADKKQREIDLAQRQSKKAEDQKKKAEEKAIKQTKKAEAKTEAERKKLASRPIDLETQKLRRKVYGKNFDIKNYDNNSSFNEKRDAYLNNITPAQQYIPLDDAKAPNPLDKSFRRKIYNIKSNMLEKIGVTKFQTIKRSSLPARAFGHIGRHIFEIAFFASVAGLVVLPQLAGAAAMINVSLAMAGAVVATGAVNIGVFGNFPIPFLFSRYSKAKKSNLRHSFEKARFDVLPNELEIANRKMKKIDNTFSKFMAGLTNENGKFSYSVDDMVKMQNELSGKKLGLIRRVSRFVKRIPIVGHLAKRMGVVNRFVDTGSVIELNKYSEKYAKSHICDVYDEYSRSVRPDDAKGQGYLDKLGNQRDFVMSQINNVKTSANAVKGTLDAISRISRIDNELNRQDLTDEQKADLVNDKKKLTNYVLSVKAQVENDNVDDEINEKKFARVNGKNIAYVEKKLKEYYEKGVDGTNEAKLNLNTLKDYKEKVVEEYGIDKWNTYADPKSPATVNSSMVYTDTPSATSEVAPTVQATPVVKSVTPVAVVKQPTSTPTTKPVVEPVVETEIVPEVVPTSKPVDVVEESKPEAQVSAEENVESAKPQAVAKSKKFTPKTTYTVKTLKNSKIKVIVNRVMENGETQKEVFTFSNMEEANIFLKINHSGVKIEPNHDLENESI